MFVGVFCGCVLGVCGVWVGCVVFFVVAEAAARQLERFCSRLLVVLVVGVEILSLFVVFRLWRVFASGWLWC